MSRVEMSLRETEVMWICFSLFGYSRVIYVSEADKHVLLRPPPG